MSNTQFSCCHLLFQFFLGRMHNFSNLINFDFLALFWKDGLLLKTETSSFWKQATTNSIQDDKQFPFQATTCQQLVNKQHQHSNQQRRHELFDNTLNKENGSNLNSNNTCIMYVFSFTNSFYFLQTMGGHHLLHGY
jgi:hypothetical protein